MQTLHVLMHIPKCGGMTVRWYYEQLFSNILVIQANKFPAPDFPYYADVLSHDAIVGHLPMRELMTNSPLLHALVDEKLLITIHSIVRDPVDRLISEFNFKRTNPAHPRHARMQEVSGTDYVLRQPDNYQARFLSALGKPASPQQISRGVNVVSLERSVPALRAYFTDQLGADLPEAEVFNVTAREFADPAEKLLSRSDFSAAELAGLYEKHAADMALYRWAQESRPLVRLGAVAV